MAAQGVLSHSKGKSGQCKCEFTFLSGFGSDKSVGDGIGSVLSTDILGVTAHHREHPPWEAKELEEEHIEQISPVDPSLLFSHWCKQPSLSSPDHQAEV